MTAQGGRVWFIHIPKTGGAAIEDAAAKIGYAWGRFDRHYDGFAGDGSTSVCVSQRYCAV